MNHLDASAFAHHVGALGRPWRTRFAPAPTGWLHLGHAVNALWVWGLARAFNGRVILRIEDHDRGRSRPEYEQGILDDLEWLGFMPDEGTLSSLRAGRSPLRQSDQRMLYQSALDRLAREGRVYPCACSRREIAAIMGEVPGRETPYPGTCRARRVDGHAHLARRVHLDRTDEAFTDLRLGPQLQRPAEQCGDLLVRDRHGDFTYQWCVVVDDDRQQVDVVIRGEDILDSTGRQLALARLLGRKQPPAFVHHPLVRRADGQKLSKSNRDTGLRDLRAEGMSPAAVLGLAAYASGLLPEARAVSLDELATLVARATAPSHMIGAA
jgi:glutamyl/glutaminyl-tRNA synthetase